MQSDLAVCLWIPSFALRCEEQRKADLAGAPAVVLAPEDSRRVWQLSREARREGVKAGMTVSQAIGLCPTLRLIEPDPVHYDEQFAHLLMRLSDVSPVIEPAELGRVYIGVDGLERLYGPAQVQMAEIATRAVGRYAVGRYGGKAVGHSDANEGTYRLTALPPYRL